MDIKPILLPQSEHQARKGRDLRKRGYSDADIADALGLSAAKVAALLGPAKVAGKPAPKAMPKPVVAAAAKAKKPAARPRA